MRKERTLLYVHFTPHNSEIIYTGITFNEFVRFLEKPINNLLLLKANCEGNAFESGFDLIEGNTEVARFSDENVYNFGDFCFVDFISHNAVRELSDESITNLLFIAHMHRPLKYLFVDKLGSRFAYLAHDDGWFCRLFCKNAEDFSDVLVRKIYSSISKKYSGNIDIFNHETALQILDITKSGALIDLDDIVMCEGKIIVRIFKIGYIADMNVIYNNYRDLIMGAKTFFELVYSDGKWGLSGVQAINGS